jgi:hypothetical protein
MKVQEKLSTTLNSYHWKTFECEICKMAYPYVLRAEGRIYKLVDIERPIEGPYLIVESLALEKNSSRTIHVIKPNLPDFTFKVGRGHESEVRVNDISVSRTHAFLKYKDGNYYIEDNMSKFGTLVQVRAQIELEAHHTKAVQIGRSVISFNVKPLTA